MKIFVMYDIPGIDGDEDRDRGAFRNALKDMQFRHVQRSVYWGECDEIEYTAIENEVYRRAQEIYDEHSEEHKELGNKFDIVVTGAESRNWSRKKIQWYD